MDKSIDDKTRWDMLYKEWEYRHRVFWISFNLWGFIIVTLIALPFVKPELFNLGWPVLVLPTFGGGVCLFANFHSLAEAKRMDLVGNAMATYRAYGQSSYEPVSLRLKHRLQALRLGKVIGNLFIYVLAPACISSAIVQSTILYSRFGNPFEFSLNGVIRACLYLIAVLLPIGGACLGASRALKAQADTQTVSEAASRGQAK